MTTKIALLTAALAAALLAPGCKDDNTGDDGGSSTPADGGDATPGAGTAGGVTQPGDTEAQGDSAYIYITSTDSDTALYQKLYAEETAFREEYCDDVCTQAVQAACGQSFDECMKNCQKIDPLFLCPYQNRALIQCQVSLPIDRLQCFEFGYAIPKEGECSKEIDAFERCADAVYDPPEPQQ